MGLLDAWRTTRQNIIDNRPAYTPVYPAQDYSGMAYSPAKVAPVVLNESAIAPENNDMIRRRETEEPGWTSMDMEFGDEVKNPNTNTQELSFPSLSNLFGSGVDAAKKAGETSIDAFMHGPVGTAYKMATHPDLPSSAIPGALAVGAVPTMMGGMAGPIGLLGGFLNSQGWYQDPSQVTGNLQLSSGGLLSGDTNQPGGGFYQTGALNNANFMQDAAINNPDMMINVQTPTGVDRKSVNEHIVDTAWQDFSWPGINTYTGEAVGTDTSSSATSDEFAWDDSDTTDWDWDL